MSEWETRRDRLGEIIDSISEFELKGKTVPYTSANGHMFSQLNKDAELGIRLSADDQASFADEHGPSEFRSYGSVMRDYVLIPDALWDDEDAIANLLRRGYAHVMSLEPK